MHHQKALLKKRAFSCGQFFRSSWKQISFRSDIPVQKKRNNKEIHKCKYSDNVFLIYWNKC